MKCCGQDAEFVVNGMSDRLQYHYCRTCKKEVTDSVACLNVILREMKDDSIYYSSTINPTAFPVSVATVPPPHDFSGVRFVNNAPVVTCKNCPITMAEYTNYQTPCTALNNQIGGPTPTSNNHNYLKGIASKPFDPCTVCGCIFSNQTFFNCRPKP